MLGEELRQAVLPRLEQDGEVAAVDHLDAERPRRAHQVAKPGVQLGRPAGEVEGADATRGEHLRDQGHRPGVHHLGAIGAGVHVTMHAGLVAAIAEIDLQRGGGLATDGGKVGGLEQRERGVHVRSRSEDR